MPHLAEMGFRPRRAPEPKSGNYSKWPQVEFRLRPLWFPHPVGRRICPPLPWDRRSVMSTDTEGRLNTISSSFRNSFRDWEISTPQVHCLCPSQGATPEQSCNVHNPLGFGHVLVSQEHLPALVEKQLGNCNSLDRCWQWTMGPPEVHEARRSGNGRPRGGCKER